MKWTVAVLALSLAAGTAQAAPIPYYDLAPSTAEGQSPQWIHPMLPGLRLVRIFPGPYNPRQRQEMCTLLARGEAGTPVRPEDVVSMGCSYLRP